MSGPLVCGGLLQQVLSFGQLKAAQLRKTRPPGPSPLLAMLPYLACVAFEH